MSEDSGGDRLLTLVGLGLVAAIVIALGVVAAGFAVGPSGGSLVDADLDLERVNDTHARIVHEGGEPIRSENLVVTVDSYERPVAMPPLLTEGDTVVFPLRDDQGARVVYDEGQNEREILARLRPGAF